MLDLPSGRCLDWLPSPCGTQWYNSHFPTLCMWGKNLGICSSAARKSPLQSSWKLLAGKVCWASWRNHVVARWAGLLGLLESLAQCCVRSHAGLESIRQEAAGSVCSHTSSGQVENQHLGTEPPAPQSAACAAFTECFQLSYFIWISQQVCGVGRRSLTLKTKDLGLRWNAIKLGAWQSGIARQMAWLPGQHFFHSVSASAEKEKRDLVVPCLETKGTLTVLHEGEWGDKYQVSFYQKLSKYLPGLC